MWPIRLTWWDRLKTWFEYDVWCWLINAPMSDPMGGHCTGRRSGKPVYCPDCDDGDAHQEPVAPKISNICPACSNSTDVPEGGSGDELNCTSCGAFLVIEEYTDGKLGLELADSEDEDAAGATVLAGE